MTASRAPYRPSVDREPPAPLRVAPYRCKFVELADRVRPSRYRSVDPCTERAARRVQIGLSLRADVCLWHSPVATERFHAHLIRDLAALETQ